MSREKFIKTLQTRRRLDTPAYKKYAVAASAGNREAQRRILQSTGYKISILDCPHWIALLAKANIFLNDIEYTKTGGIAGVSTQDSNSSDTIIVA